MAALVVATALGLGIIAGPGVTALGVCVAAIVGIGALLGLIWLPRSGTTHTAGATWSLAIASVCLGVVAAQPRPLPSNARGQAPSNRDLVAVVVVESAWPGPRCDVAVRGPDGPRTARFEADSCDHRRGDVLWIRPAASRRRGGGVDPFLRPADSRAFLAARRHIGAQRLIWLRRRAFEKGRRDAAWGLLGAAIVGHRRALPPLARVTLARAGLGHLVAISGLHVGLLGAGLWRLADRIPVSPRRLVMKSWRSRLMRFARLGLVAAAVVIVGAFVWASGHSPPSVRASLYLALVPLARWRGRPIHGPSALAVVASAMMLVDPRSALSASFQLSFAAMAAIVAPGAVKNAWTVSRDVAWATSGIAVAHFGAAALWGIALNLVAVPVFAACLVPSALAGAALWCGPPGLAALEAWAWRLSHGAASLLLDLARFGAALPVVPLHVAVVFGAAWVMVDSMAGRRGPPRLGILALAVAALWSSRGVAGSRSVAFGSVRSPGVAVMTPRSVCVAGVGPSPGLWGARLDALEIPRGTAVTLEAPQPAAPHWIEAAESIRASGWSVTLGPCGEAQRSEAQRARAALEACRGRLGGDWIFDSSAAPSACVDGILGRDDGA